jgi:hypothetical protein
VSSIQNESERTMETDAMGRVTVAAKFETIGHFAMVERGLLSSVPSLEVSDAQVDPSVLSVCMPAKLIRQLDLMPCRPRTERIGDELALRKVHGAIRLTVLARECTTDVVEVPDDHPVLIGRIPLQLLDFVIDASGPCLIGNPAHGGEQMIEMYQMTMES